MKPLVYLFIVIASVALSTLSGCSERLADLEQTLTYRQDGVSFTYPGNWKVTEDTTIENARFIFLESTAEAIIKIEIYPLDESYELKEFIELDIEAMNDEYSKVFSIKDDYNVTPVVTSLANVDLEGFQYAFTFAFLGVDVPHVSNYYLFSSDTLAAYVSQQVSVEDLGKVIGGFHLVLEHFEIE